MVAKRQRCMARNLENMGHVILSSLNHALAQDMLHEIQCLLITIQFNKCVNLRDIRVFDAPAI
ncbi:hypothetical protein CRI94_09560 [Longibacter salinarum]|uniref:Uncharacterized protein n=2 Tax=Longibacter salinarum TaxID=1850348 RepID=A0A2A8CYS5_9BACT|nr:hypothetical protein CRI94_09560 [Longibacter salinarum]